jgi:hypothetical protein
MPVPEFLGEEVRDTVFFVYDAKTALKGLPAERGKLCIAHTWRAKSVDIYAGICGLL